MLVPMNPKLRAASAALLVTALAVVGIAVPSSPAQAASVGPGYDYQGDPHSHLGGYLNPDGTVGYCIDAGKPSPVGGATTDGGVVDRVNGRSASVMLQLSWLLLRYGGSRDDDVSAAVALVVVGARRPGRSRRARRRRLRHHARPGRPPGDHPGVGRSLPRRGACLPAAGRGPGAARVVPRRRRPGTCRAADRGHADRRHRHAPAGQRGVRRHRVADPRGRGRRRGAPGHRCPARGRVGLRGRRERIASTGRSTPTAACTSGPPPAPRPSHRRAARRRRRSWPRRDLLVVVPRPVPVPLPRVAG